MIAPKCDRCGEELDAPGGLAFSPPPTVEHASTVEKLHLCVPCWSDHFLPWLHGAVVSPNPEPTQ